MEKTKIIEKNAGIIYFLFHKLEKARKFNDHTQCTEILEKLEKLVNNETVYEIDENWMKSLDNRKRKYYKPKNNLYTSTLTES
jgi:cell division FtsZ-interacting protein ZapD